MVDVGVAEHDGIDRVDRDGERRILCPRLTPSPLEQPAIEQHGPFANADDMAGAGYLTGGTGKFYMHHRKVRAERASSQRYGQIAPAEDVMVGDPLPSDTALTS